MHIEMQARVAGGEEAAKWARVNAANYAKPVEGSRLHVDAQQNVWMDSQVFVRWADHSQLANAVKYGQEKNGDRYTLYSHDEGENWFGPYFDRSPGVSDEEEDEEDLVGEKDEEDPDSAEDSELGSNSSGSQPDSSDSSILSTSSGSGILSASYSSSSNTSVITVHSTR